jgi:hypothetical protein
VDYNFCGTDNDMKAWVTHISENVIRKPLRPTEASETIETARTKFKLKNGEIAEKMGVSRIRVVQLHGIKRLPEDLVLKLEESEKITRRHVEAFKRLLGKHKPQTIKILPDDSEQIRIAKGKAEELLNMIMNENMSGEQAVEWARETYKEIRDKSKSFLTVINYRINEALKRRPTRMSKEKRTLVISQAKNIIDMMQRLVEEEEKKILR